MNWSPAFIYEMKPYVCGVVGCYAASMAQAGLLAKSAGLLLITCGGLILYMRARHRGMIS